MCILQDNLRENGGGGGVRSVASSIKSSAQSLPPSNQLRSGMSPPGGDDNKLDMQWVTFKFGGFLEQLVKYRFTPLPPASFSLFLANKGLLLTWALC